MGPKKQIPIGRKTASAGNTRSVSAKRATKPVPSKPGTVSKGKVTITATPNRSLVSKHLQQVGLHKRLPAIPSIYDNNIPKTKKISATHPYYKRPVEKLLKKVKQHRKAEGKLPRYVNIHKHRARRYSFIAGRGADKQVELIHRALTRHGKNLQPKVGWEYNKRQKRLLLGFRHRRLEPGLWRFFEPIKDFFPRHIKPNSHKPDALFFLLNILIFMSTGLQIGVGSSVLSYVHIIEDSVEHQMFKEGKATDRHQGFHFWMEHAPFHLYARAYINIAIAMQFFTFIGLIGVYIAEQGVHVAYVIGIFTCIAAQAILAVTFRRSNYCSEVTNIMGPRLHEMVNDYYHKIPAIDDNGVPIMIDKAGVLEQVQVRTHRAANVMDKIQKAFHCCGVNGYKDYESKGETVPSSCCTPLWNLNPYCANVIPTDPIEMEVKIVKSDDGGCKKQIDRACMNVHRLLGSSAEQLSDLQLAMFAFSCIALIVQARQIRQLRRPPHLRISAGSISQSLQVGSSGAKSGGEIKILEQTPGPKLTDKQAEHLQQLRRESGLADQEEESESSSSEEEEVVAPTIDFKNVQQFVETEEKQLMEKPTLDKAVEGFAGRFNIVSNRFLEGYVQGIFSSTYQNETNAALEAINKTLENQFAQHTTEYDWRKLLTKKNPTGKMKAPVASQDEPEKQRGLPPFQRRRAEGSEQIIIKKVHARDESFDRKLS